MKEYLKLVLPWLLLGAFPVFGQPVSNNTYTVNLSVDASTDTNAFGYAFYVWTNSFFSGTNQLNHWTNSGVTMILARTNLTVTASNLTAGVTYYAVATAYTVNGIESDYSNEVTWTVTKPTPPHLHVNIKFQAATTVNGPWEDLANLGDFDVQPDLPFYRALLTIH